jgi:hypothetical protein
MVSSKITLHYIQRVAYGSEDEITLASFSYSSAIDEILFERHLILFNLLLLL